MNRSLWRTLLLYLKALVYWILVFGVQSVVHWLSAKPGNYLVSPGPFDDFMPIKDPGLFLLFCVTIVPITAVMLKRPDQPNDDRI